MARKKSKPNPVLAWLLSWIVPAYIRLIELTTKWEKIGEENFNAARDNPAGMIVVFWHSRILMMVGQRKHYPRKFWFMVSEHRDGELITQAVKRCDISFARGSTVNARKKAKSKSGSNALRVLLKALKDGDGVGLTPDGPRGPREKCHMGVVQLAKLSGVSVYPAAYSVKRARFLSSWDRFHFPFPFTKGCIVYGAPIAITGNTPEELEQERLKIESAIKEVTNEADRRVGHFPIRDAKAADKLLPEQSGKPVT